MSGTLDGDLLIRITVLSGGVLVVVVAVGLALMQMLDGARRRRDRRIAGMQARLGGQGLEMATGALLKKDTTLASSPTLDRILKRALPSPEKLSERLSRTGRQMSPGVYVLISLLVGVVAMLVAYWYLPVPQFALPPIGIAVGMFVPHFVVGRIIARRQAAFLVALPEAIDLIVRGLRSGLPVTDSMTAVGREMPAPVGDEFKRAMESVQLGQSLEAAMAGVVRRTGLPEMQFFAVSLSIQRETGGNLAETMENLADILRQRRQMKLKIRAMSSEARASAMIIGSLPFIMFVIIYLLNYDYAMTLILDPRGNMMLVVAGIMMGLGVAVMAKMIRFEI